MSQHDVYNLDFYQHVDRLAYSSAQVIVPTLLGAISVDSVIDVGCGTGAWLAVFREQGVNNIVGIEGPWILNYPEIIRIPFDKIIIVNDLCDDWNVSTRFDLALCLEVAEHLPYGFSRNLIERLVSLAPVVLFSAAVPGQEGTYHVNEQWPEFWERLFGEHDYVLLDLLRPRIWQNPAVAWFYQQNVYLYVHRPILGTFPSLKDFYDRTRGCPLTLVHKKILRPCKGLRAYLRILPRVARETLRRRYFGKSCG